MKNTWKIVLPKEETERIAITYGDPADCLIAKDNYALFSVPEAITNWQAIAPLLQTNHWYDITAFYSRRKINLSKQNAKLLYEYNQQAYDAAKEKGGLILYYQGVIIGNVTMPTDSNLKLRFVPNSLSFCIWETLQLAKAGAKIPEHKRAIEMLALWYEGFAIEKYQLMVQQTKKNTSLVFQKVAYQH